MRTFPRRAALALSAGFLLLFLALPARGQTPEGAASGVYVPRDARVEEALLAFRRAEARGDWEEALARCEEVGSLLVLSGEVPPLAATDEGTYFPAPQVLRDAMARWPEAGLAAYRARYDHLARVDLEEARRRRDESLLLPALEHPLSTGSDAAMLLAADLALERGDLDLALERYRDLADLVCDPRWGTESLLARVGFAGARAGRPGVVEWALARALRLTGASETLVGGRHVPLVEYLEGELRRAEDIETAASSGSGPLPGGEAWTFRIPEPALSERAEEICRARGLPAPHPVRVAAGPGGVVVATPTAVFALDARSGGPRWRFPEILRAPPSVQLWDVPLGALWAKDEAVGVRDLLLAGFDGRTGKMRWRIRFDRPEESPVPDVTWVSSPAWDGERIYVALAAGGQNAGVHLAAVAPGSGRVLYSRFLYQGSRAAYLAYPNPASAPAYQDGRDFVSGGRGATAAVEASSGRILWVAPYPTPEPEGVLARLRDRSGWAAGSVVAARGLVVAAPPEGDHLIAHDERTGKIAWRIPRGPWRRLVARYQRIVLVTGDGEAAGVDMATGKIAWRRRIPDTDSGAEPALSEGRLWIPCRDRTLALDPGSGEVVSTLRGSTGSIVGAPAGGIFLAGPRSVAFHPPRAASDPAAPDDPRVDLEEGRVGADLDEVLSRALERASGDEEKVRLLSLAASLHESRGRPDRAVKLHLSILDLFPETRSELPEDGGPTQAGTVARAAIEDLLAHHGADVLSGCEVDLERLYREAAQARTASAALALVERYPFHPRAGEALELALGLAEDADRVEVASRIASLLDAGAARPCDPEFVRALVRAFEEGGHPSAARGLLELAARWEGGAAGNPPPGALVAVDPVLVPEGVPNLVWKSSITGSLERGRFVHPAGSVPAVAGDLVLVAATEGGVSFLEARNARAGELLWRRPVGTWQGTAWAGGRLLLMGRSRAYGLEPETGRIAWSYDVAGGTLVADPSEMGPPIFEESAPNLLHQFDVRGDQCLLSGTDGSAHLLDARAGTLSWRTPPSGGLLQFPLLSSSGPAAYACATLPPRLLAIDLVTGSVTATARAKLRSRPLEVPGALVALVEEEGGSVELASFGTADLTRRWSRPDHAWLASPPVLLPGGEELLLAGNRNAGARLLVISARDGKDVREWGREGNPIRLGPVLADRLVWVAAGTTRSYRLHGFDHGTAIERTLPWPPGDETRFDVLLPWREFLIAHEGTDPSLVFVERRGGRAHYLALRHGVKEVYDITATLTTLVVSTDRGLFGFEPEGRSRPEHSLAASFRTGDLRQRALAYERRGMHEKALSALDAALATEPTPAGVAFAAAADRIGGLAELAAQRSPGEHEISYCAVPPAIDGRLDEAWGGELACVPLDSFRHLELVSRPTRRHDDWDGPGDLSGRLFLGYDDENLYLALEVRDDSGIPFDSEDGRWVGDNLLVSFDWTSDGGFAYGLHDQMMWLFNPRPPRANPAPGPGGAAKAAADEKKQEIPGSEQAIQWSDDGLCRTYEWSIPWQATGADPPGRVGPGFRFRMNVYVMDDDDSRGVTRGIAWAPGNFFDEVKEHNVRRFTPEYFVRVALAPRRAPAGE
ncbi:MAG: PQQ-binding-like beta-propeller repeat protein [Planctomycetes bacterium]|nr:PQQ-binding-like beta-propeller repeat protein [Planctomycetota bacterium]